MKTRRSLLCASFCLVVAFVSVPAWTGGFGVNGEAVHGGNGSGGVGTARVRLGPGLLAVLPAGTVLRDPSTVVDAVTELPVVTFGRLTQQGLALSRHFLDGASVWTTNGIRYWMGRTLRSDNPNFWVVCLDSGECYAIRAGASETFAKTGEFLESLSPESYSLDAFIN